MLQLVIPTHRRTGRQITLAALPASLRESVILVTSDPAETDILKKTHKRTVTAVGVHNIAEKRQWILENVKAEKFFMLDDDMTFFGRCPLNSRSYATGGRWKPRVVGSKGLSLDFASSAQVEAMFLQIEVELAAYKHAGISSRLGNDLEFAEWRRGPQRMMHALGYDRKFLLKHNIRFDAVAVREDFHVTLELLKRKEPSSVCYEFCVSPGAYGAKGGCTDERTVADSNSAAYQLAELHKPFVKVVDKLYKGTPRKEVVVSWKRAYNAA